MQPVRQLRGGLPHERPGVLSQEYQLAGFSRHDFHFDLLGRLRERVAARGLQPKPKPAPAEGGEGEAKPRKAQPKSEAAPAETKTEG